MFNKLYDFILNLTIFIICITPAACIAADIVSTSTTAVTAQPAQPATSPAWYMVIFTGAGMALYFVWNKYIRPLLIIHVDNLEDKIQAKIKEEFGTEAGDGARQAMESIETIILEIVDTLITKKMGSRQLAQAIIQKKLLYDILEECKKSELLDQHDAGIILMNELEVQLAKLPGLLTPIQALEILNKAETHASSENKTAITNAIRILKEKIDGLSIRV